MATFGDLVQKTWRRLEPYGLTQTLVLAQPSLVGATTLVVADPSGILLPNLQAGQTLGIDLEVFFVQATSATGVTVVPGYQGSTPAAHTADTIVYINPRFSFFDIGTAINDDLLDLSAPDNGLFQVKSLEITYNPSIVGYDMVDVTTRIPVTTFTEIISVRYKVPYPIGKWIPVPYGMWEVTPASDLIAFPSGYALTLNTDGYPGLPIRITYSAPFGQFVNLTDDATTVAGLSATMYDLPPLGAEVALVVAREVRRNQLDSEPDSRRAPEVPPGAVMNSTAGVMRLRQSRINAESARLEALYGSQRTMV